MLATVDREAIAREARRRQALEALEFERSRAAALRDRLESIVVELHGPSVDDAAFARMTADDVQIVRPALQGEEPVDPEPFDLERALEDDDGGDEHAAWLEEEIVRLQEELRTSDRKLHAFEQYLAALGTA
jgi:hypothetical protein